MRLVCIDGSASGKHNIIISLCSFQNIKTQIELKPMTGRGKTIPLNTSIKISGRQLPPSPDNAYGYSLHVQRYVIKMIKLRDRFSKIPSNKFVIKYTTTRIVYLQFVTRNLHISYTGTAIHLRFKNYFNTLFY